MARRREPGDWERDLDRARRVERQVGTALKAIFGVTAVSDLTEQTKDLDFEFPLDGGAVRVDVKLKEHRSSAELAALWPEVPPEALFVLDETAFRTLVWPEGMGYLLIKDCPTRRWHVLGPWELLLGPRRRFERLGDKGRGAFLKGKMLIDLRTAAETTKELSVDALVRVARSSHRARTRVQAFRVPGQTSLPVIPVAPQVAPAGSKAPSAPDQRPPGEGPPQSEGPPPGEGPSRSKAPSAPDQRPPGSKTPPPPAEGPPRSEGPPESEGLHDRDGGGGARIPVGPAPEVDPRWAGLNPGLVAAVKSAWGWDEPTAVQALAIPLVLAGDNVLIVAPTAGGKTEAALLPLLEHQTRCGWARPSILMISPLKALLDDQLARYRAAAALTGATVFAMHGDVERAQKEAFAEHPADILLTTPESLERLLSQPALDARRHLRNVRAIVVDELHAFVGTPRGAQLAAQIERLDQLADADLQRVGLSATVAKPDQVLRWLTGGSLRAGGIAQPGQRLKGEELAISTYETPAESATLIGAAVTGRRALVFAPSRRRAEQLGTTLGAPVHHSSVAAEGRRASISALVDGPSGCLVATSGLELGIDIGDIDLVVNDGAPTDPGAYLQRLGRSGRRDGNRRMLITVGDADSLLLALAAVARSRRGALDPVPPRRGARLVLGQQALMLAFERLSYTPVDLHEYLRFSPLFRPLGAEIDATITHLVANGWLARVGPDEDILIVGPAATARFGGKGFFDLLATFSAAQEASVVTEGGRPVGSLDWDEVSDAAGRTRPGPVVLAGTRWLLISVDRPAGTVTVAPAPESTEGSRVPSWRGPSLEVGRATWETAREILRATDVPGVIMDARGERWLDDLQRAWRPRLATPARAEGGHTVVDAFAGAAVHRAVLAALDREGSVDGPSCHIDGAVAGVAEQAKGLLGDLDRVFEAEAARQSARLVIRHPDLVAPSVRLAEARRYHVDRVGITRTLSLLAAAPSMPGSPAAGRD
ncbi:MAG: ATP-dependent helicase Lhr and Lhr-like helicase [Acidimicrobiaceae bacterium]|nr:ATP-dependent helicase Lhr and Lhr-like helicase [Acidimicrobiaceae bacterium]